MCWKREAYPASRLVFQTEHPTPTLSSPLGLLLLQILPICLLFGKLLPFGFLSSSSFPGCLLLELTFGDEDGLVRPLG